MRVRIKRHSLPMAFVALFAVLILSTLMLLGPKVSQLQAAKGEKAGSTFAIDTPLQGPSEEPNGMKLIGWDDCSTPKDPPAVDKVGYVSGGKGPGQVVVRNATMKLLFLDDFLGGLEPGDPFLECFGIGAEYCGPFAITQKKTQKGTGKASAWFCFPAKSKDGEKEMTYRLYMDVEIAPKGDNWPLDDIDVGESYMVELTNFALSQDTGGGRSQACTGSVPGTAWIEILRILPTE